LCGTGFIGPPPPARRMVSGSGLHELGVGMVELDAIERSETLGQKVYERVRRAVIGGAFEPGEQVTIRSLARLMQVSPTPAREALNRLAAEGALEFGRNRTLFVPRLQPDRIRELYQIRLPLEDFAARAALPHMGKAHVDALTQCVEQRIVALGQHDYRTALELNRDFSFSIFEAAQQPIALRILEGLWLLAGPMMNLLFPEYADHQLGIERAREQIRAIETRDVEALCQSLRTEREEAAELILTKVGRGEVARSSRPAMGAASRG